MEETHWIYCPKCGEKTKVKVYEQTVIKKFPLFCPWCKSESIINVKNGKVTLIGNNEK